MDEIDRAYKSIGEFVVTFQWIENKYREIGWLILDPERKNWPPQAFRKEKNKELIDAVTKVFCDLVDKYNIPEAGQRKTELLALSAEFHKLRKYRNSLLHSVFVELKAGGEVAAILRSDPRPILDTETGELTFVRERFTEESVHKKLREIAEAAFRLGMLYMQLIHWSPFERFPEKPKS